jgi:aspartyl-tRNA synthetase
MEKSKREFPDSMTTPYRQSACLSNLRLRARILRTVRQFFTENDYLEVETPIRTPHRPRRRISTPSRPATGSCRPRPSCA